MSGLDMDAFVQRLMRVDALRGSDNIVKGEQERIEPDLAEEWPAGLDPRVRDSLTTAGLARPYRHQSEAVNLALTGADVVMESPTASGKTLAFVAPMLHVLKKDPEAHALMLYPMKALAFDQREQLREICRPLGFQSWPYDGDTDENDKRMLREHPPRILLTNPEYLNRSFLGERGAWSRHEGGAKFLQNLRYLVIDEMHEYRGFFGSNVALLLRRFFRYLDGIGTCPQVFLSTATCANPQEHAKELTGRDVQLVSARDVFRPKRHFMFVDPDIPDFQYRDILRLRVEHAAMAALEEGLQVLVFCPTKRFLEDAFRRCRDDAKQNGVSRRVDHCVSRGHSSGTAASNPTTHQVRRNTCGIHHQCLRNRLRCWRSGRGDSCGFSSQPYVGLAADWPSRTWLGQGRFRPALRYERPHRSVFRK